MGSYDWMGCYMRSELLHYGTVIKYRTDDTHLMVLRLYSDDANGLGVVVTKNDYDTQNWAVGTVHDFYIPSWEVVDA